MGDSLVPVDGDLKPLRNMIMAFDTRARREAEEITYLVGDEKFRAITGGPCFSTLLCSKILWLKRHEPDVYQRARRYLSIQEYLLCRMGLGIHIDYTLACRKSLFDVVGKEWSDTIASCIGIDVSQAGGEVHDSACVLASLDRIGDVRRPREIPIVLGAHDAECGFLGLGVNPERDRIFGDVSGTDEMRGSFSRGRAPTAVCTPAELGCAFSRDTHSINGAAIAGRYISWYPVSYTHLDVYKRQDLSCVTSSMTRERDSRLLPLIFLPPPNGSSAARKLPEPLMAMWPVFSLLATWMQV